MIAIVIKKGNKTSQSVRLSDKSEPTNVEKLEIVLGDETDCIISCTLWGDKVNLQIFIIFVTFF